VNASVSVVAVSGEYGRLDGWESSSCCSGTNDRWNAAVKLSPTGANKTSREPDRTSAALELRDGDYVNLGIELPTLMPS
jgi:hypothetical protein